MSCVDVRERWRDSPLRARSLFTVRAASSSARDPDAPRSFALSLMCSYWRARLVPFFTPLGGMPSGYPPATPGTLPMSVLALAHDGEGERYEQHPADAEQHEADRDHDDAAVDGGHRDAGDERDRADRDQKPVAGHGPESSVVIRKFGGRDSDASAGGEAPRNCRRT